MGQIFVTASIRESCNAESMTMMLIIIDISGGFAASHQHLDVGDMLASAVPAAPMVQVT